LSNLQFYYTKKSPIGEIAEKKRSTKGILHIFYFSQKIFCFYIYYIYKLNSPSGTPRIVSRTIIAIIKYHIFIKKTTGLVDK